MCAFWRRSPVLKLSTAAEHAAVLRWAEDRLKRAQEFTAEMALWPSSLAVIRAACGIGPAVEYPDARKPAASLNAVFEIAYAQAAESMMVMLESGRSFSLRQMEARYGSNVAKAAFDHLLTAKEDELTDARPVRVRDFEGLRRIWESRHQ